MEDKEFYRKQIIEMVKNVKRMDILVYIYKMTKYIVAEDCDDKHGLQKM